MLKEICEQPESLCNTLRGHLLEEEGTSRVCGLNLSDDEHSRGSSASSSPPAAPHGTPRSSASTCWRRWRGFRSRWSTPPSSATAIRWSTTRTLVIGISQSGETADTLAAIREAKLRGARTIGLVNVVGSTIAREVDGGIYLHAGPEVGVASTKAFTSQVAALALVTLRIARLRNLSILQGREFIHALQALPGQIQQILDAAAEVERLAERFVGCQQRALPGPGRELPGGAGGRAQDEGDLVHPRRGLSGGGDEARAHRADRREHAGGVHRAAATRCTRRSCPTSKR